MSLAGSQPVCVLASGGIESSALLGLLAATGRRVQPLYVASGMRWEAAEQYWLRRFVTACALPGLLTPVVLELPVSDVYGQHWSVGGKGVPEYHAPDEAVYLPGRNLLLLGKGAVYCALHEYAHLAIGILRGNPFPDASSQFLRQCETTLSMGLDHQLTIETPFAQSAKQDVLQQARHLPLHLSFSCVNPAGRHHCGACNKCRERHEAFLAANQDDSTEYATAPQEPR